MSTPTSFLERASADARLAAERRAERVPLAELRRAAAAAPPTRGFQAAVARAGFGGDGDRTPDDLSGGAPGSPPRAGDLAAGTRVALIAEVKRRSPSKGDLRPDLDPAALAGAYRGGGASAVSVLTEPVHFAGGPEDLQKVRAAVDLPVLRKDFVTVPYQVWEARAWGADAVLLIVAALDPPLLADLLAEADAAGLDPLVEVHTPEEAATAAAAGAGLIGVNARDLATLTVDLRRFAMVRESLPPGATLVAESGIRTRADVEAVAAAGAHAVLVGEALVLAPDPEAAAAELLGRTRSTGSGNQAPATKDG